MSNDRTKATRKRSTAPVSARWISLVVTVVAVMAAVPQPASAAGLVPFQGTVAEHFTVVPSCFPTQLCATITGSGHASHLGNVAESAAIVSELSKPLGAGCFPETRTTTLTAANGDQITLDAAGQNCATGPTTVTASDTYTVTGGTGRFVGASGSGTISVSVDLASATALVTFSGTLSSPGSLQ